MAISLHFLILITAQLAFFLFLRPTLTEAATCNDCFTQSRAAYYPNSDDAGTDAGACGFGSFGAKVNGGDVSAASQLYRDGVGCGACYQEHCKNSASKQPVDNNKEVRCTNAQYCSGQGVTAAITDHGESDRTDFILSRHAFAKMAQTNDSAASLLSLGVVDVEYRRVSCNYPDMNIMFKIDESSNFPHYLAFVIWYQQGKKDVIAVQLCETNNLGCKLLDRSRGAVWTVVRPPSGPLSIRMMLTDSEDGEETWVIPPNPIPQDWKAGEVYDSGVQLES